MMSKKKKIFRTSDFDPRKVLGIDWKEPIWFQYVPKDTQPEIRERIIEQFRAERNHGAVVVNELEEVFHLNTPSLIEKWAEEDLNSGVEYALYDQHRLYEIIGEGGFMEDE